MAKTKLSKKKKIAVVVAPVVLLGSGAAFAFWTAGGSGTGTAATKDATTAVTVNQTSTPTAIAPGVAPQTLSGNFTNPNTGPVYVGSVTVTIASVTKSGVAAVGCDASDYTLTGTTMTVNEEVATGSNQGSWSGATVAFNNKNVNQDACKGATVNFAYKAL